MTCLCLSPRAGGTPAPSGGRQDARTAKVSR